MKMKEVLFGGVIRWFFSLFNRPKGNKGVYNSTVFGNNNIYIIVDSTSGAGGLLKQVLTGEAPKQLGE
jgi:hypothetical protein